MRLSFIFNILTQLIFSYFRTHSFSTKFFYQSKFSVSRKSTLLSTIQTSPSLSVPPTSFINCVQQAIEATKKALSNGEKLIEVEFPPLPLEVLEDSSSSARDIADANTRLDCDSPL